MGSKDDGQLRKTIFGRVFGLWALTFLLTIFLAARPTDFAWPFWTYGLIWGVSTSVVHYVFRSFFETTIPIQPQQQSQDH